MRQTERRAVLDDSRAYAQDVRDLIAEHERRAAWHTEQARVQKQVLEAIHAREFRA